MKEGRWKELLDTNGDAIGSYVDGDLAFVADGNSGIAFIDISNPSDPEILKNITLSGEANDIVVSGNYAYVANGVSGLAIIQVYESIDPETAVYGLTGNGNGIYLSGDYAYLVNGSALTIGYQRLAIKNYQIKLLFGFGKEIFLYGVNWT